MGNSNSLLDNTGNVIQTAFTWLAYNRDMYADNVGMRQSQLYQKRNYHLSWISVARDDVRDVMQTSVDKVNSYMVVTTLIFGIAAGMVVELDTSECSYLFKVLIYMCLTVAMIYLMMSIIYAVLSSNAAFSYSVDILVNAIRPDPTDAYDKSFDYMKQTYQFEKSLSSVLRIPILKPMYRNYACHKRPRLEHFNIGKGLMPKITGSTEEFEDDERSPSKRVASEQEARNPYGPHAPEQQLVSEDVKSNINLMFDQFSKVSWLWVCFERASMGGLSYGSLYLGYAAAYVSIGVLGESERWIGEILALLWIVSIILFFLATLPNNHTGFNAMDFSLWGAEQDVQFQNRFGKYHLYFMLATSYAPPLVVLVLQLLVKKEVIVSSNLSWMEAVCHFFHFLASFIHIVREATTEIKLSESLQSMKKKMGEDEHEKHVSSEGNGLSPTAAAIAHKYGVSNDSFLDHSSDPDAQEDDPDYGAHCDMDADAEGDRNFEEVDPNQGRLMPRDIAQKTVQRIESSFQVVRRSIVLIHSFIALGWFCFWLEAVCSEEAGHPRALSTQVKSSWDESIKNSVTQIVEFQVPSFSKCRAGEACSDQVEWPSEFFQPLAMACAKGNVFVADEFHVYQLASGALSPLPCLLPEEIVDISTACNATSCWPLVLMGRERTNLVNCQTGEAFSFAQTERAERIACRNASLDGALYALRAGQLIEYRLGQQLRSLEPWWPVADVDAAGMRAVEVLDGRVFLFRNSVSRGVTSITLESHVLKKNSSAVRVWTLPKQSRTLIGGCMLTGSAALLLLQSQDGDYPRFVKMELS